MGRGVVCHATGSSPYTGVVSPGNGRPSVFKVHKPHFGTTTEVHASVADRPSASGAVGSNGATAVAVNGAGTVGRLGAVPGRPILDVAGWQDSILARSSMGLQPQQQMPPRLRIFSGTSNPSLAAEVASYLGTELGKIKIKRFADGEIYVQVGESIRGADVFLVQPTSPPVNDHFMELAVMIDACRRASARSITAVIPYYGYARADRKTQGRESIAAKLTANLITEAVILDYLASKRIATGDLVVVSPDVGGVARARAFAKKLNDAPLAIVDKRRSAHNVSEVMNLIGDVKGKNATSVQALRE
ncbi:ribose-phosphate pyrophosphokinase [Monoraphidium neglectum]|uniref:ribose-phosphate diphosphokinase n=1 Tax=Monoraphidium neglectum TaxID=145388 RepID=A0A0D2MY18_9CHLO|nr:ribose-phosphate pyrophosphokinase [Monoraphidium neglectum]KIZ07375.1 ribose-phosphate pyrophosphokinase [Monoraphidium neglectum]|eukprot:XP_013906394.1 ribose-phosphate pyrophosphokinase [Monoraphidium neglectum]